MEWYTILKAVGVIILILWGLILNAKVQHLAWNMPEAYIPAKLSLIPIFLAGFLIGLR